MRAARPLSAAVPAPIAHCGPTGLAAPHKVDIAHMLRDLLMGRANKYGRSKGEKHVRIPHHMITSPAFRSLNGAALKVYVELADRYNGSNNGELHLSYGVAAKLLHLSKSTVSRGFKELSGKGFIKCASPGNWYDRRAATWILTHRADNRPNGPLATNEWHRWSPNGKAFLGTEAAPDGYRDGTSTVPK